MHLCKIQISMYTGQKELTPRFRTAIIKLLSGLSGPLNFYAVVPCCSR